MFTGIPGMAVFYTKNAEIPGVTSFEVWLPMISVGFVFCSSGFGLTRQFQWQFHWLRRLAADLFLAVPIVVLGTIGVLFILGTLTMPFFSACGTCVLSKAASLLQCSFGKFIVAFGHSSCALAI